MTPKRRPNGAHAAPDPFSPFLSIMQAPTANSFFTTQRVALEAARFWARRIHAYADQMEQLAGCSTPDQLAGAQTRFLERMREDYAAESQAISALLTPEQAARRDEGEEAEA